jgi:hypothetical protein
MQLSLSRIRQGNISLFKKKAMFKKVFFILFLFLVGSLGISYYYWNQLTQLPQWYQAEQPNSSSINLQDKSSLATAKAEIHETIEKQIAQQRSSNPNGEVNIKLNQQEVNQLLISQLAENPNSQKFLQAAKGIQATVNNNALEIGAVVNPSEVLSQNLSSEQSGTIEKLVNQFPQLKNKDIYVSFSGKPQIINGELILDENSKIKVGNVSLTLNEVAQKLGISPEAAKQAIALKINQFNLQNIAIQDQEVILTIKP